MTVIACDKHPCLGPNEILQFGQSQFVFDLFYILLYSVKFEKYLMNSDDRWSLRKINSTLKQTNIKIYTEPF